MTSMIEKIDECNKKLSENATKMTELQLAMDGHRVALDKTATYASVAASQPRSVGDAQQRRDTLHSVVITSKDETHSGEEVLQKIREAMDAKEGWIKVERVRKAKDRKIIMGFATETERDKAKQRLSGTGVDLAVEEVKNRDPLLVIRDVLSVNTDEDIVKALRNQNREVFGLLDGEDDRLQIKYRRRARNPHTCHVIVSVTPKVWQRATSVGHVHVDLQRVRVEDQSPLVQCTRCLGFGHGRRFCTDPADLCSHCGGPHLRAECADWMAAAPPSCRNCSRAKSEHADHNAFSMECPIRKRWDNIARAAVAYH